MTSHHHHRHRLYGGVSRCVCQLVVLIIITCTHGEAPRLPGNSWKVEAPEAHRVPDDRGVHHNLRSPASSELKARVGADPDAIKFAGLSAPLLQDVYAIGYSLKYIKDYRVAVHRGSYGASQLASLRNKRRQFQGELENFKEGLHNVLDVLKDVPDTVAECVVCLEPKNLSDFVVLGFHCQHKVCEECKRQMEKHEQKCCPLCRAKESSNTEIKADLNSVAAHVRTELPTWCLYSLNCCIRDAMKIETLITELASIINSFSNFFVEVDRAFKEHADNTVKIMREYGSGISIAFEKPWGNPGASTSSATRVGALLALEENPRLCELHGAKRKMKSDSQEAFTHSLTLLQKVIMELPNVEAVRTKLAPVVKDLKSARHIPDTAEPLGDVVEKVGKLATDAHALQRHGQVLRTVNYSVFKIDWQLADSCIADAIEIRRKALLVICEMVRCPDVRARYAADAMYKSWKSATKKIVGYFEALRQSQPDVRFRQSGSGRLPTACNNVSKIANHNQRVTKLQCDWSLDRSHSTQHRPAESLLAMSSPAAKTPKSAPDSSSSQVPNWSAVRATGLYEVDDLRTEAIEAGQGGQRRAITSSPPGESVVHPGGG
eukprot:GHVQ01011087.1.p1 GENE.GHVQ01011087.1~~GHVQ01011087.1.p1  ORF type:complete len:604 (+),score=33.56 GHVQ01011087.1:157-1968(+)